MKFRFSLTAVLILALFLSQLITSCASGNTHKKLKPGKPIPCPQKDC